MCSQSFWLVRNDRPQAVQAGLLLGRERVGVGRVERREVRVVERVADAVDGDGPPRRGRSGGRSRRWSSSHSGLRAIDLAFELELHDRDGLLHPGDEQVGPQPSPLGTEARRGVVGVDRPGQVLQRVEGDAVALFELGEPAVAERDAQHVADQGLVAEAGAEPGGVVVAPDERDVRLPPEVVDDAVAARARGPSSRRR